MAECGRDDEKEDGNFRHACEREFTLYSLPFILYLFIFLLKKSFLNDFNFYKYPKILKN